MHRPLRDIRPVFLLAVLLLLLNFDSSASADSPSAQINSDGRWPGGMFSAGLLYVPAPLIQEREEDRSDKLLDQLGWQIVLEFRTLEYLTVGAQVSGLYSARQGDDGGSSLMEAGFRLGVFFPLNDRWAVRTAIVGGVSGLRSNDPDRVSSYESNFWGFQGWAIAGLVYRLNRHLILYADFSGSVARYDGTIEIFGGNPQFKPYRNPNLFRLHFGTGIAFCWERVRRQ